MGRGAYHLAMPHADPARIRLLVLDVDGVLTDGSINYDDHGLETKRFHVRDGFGIRLWQEAGQRVAILTGRTGSALLHRLADHQIDLVVQGSKDKGAGIGDLAARAGVEPGEMAYLGDDWPDLGAMRAVGYPMAVADAEPAVLGAAAWVTPRGGGRGAVRDAVEHLLEARGALGMLRKRYHAGE